MENITIPNASHLKNNADFFNKNEKLLVLKKIYAQCDAESRKGSYATRFYDFISPEALVLLEDAGYKVEEIKERASYERFEHIYKISWNN